MSVASIGVGPMLPGGNHLPLTREMPPVRPVVFTVPAILMIAGLAAPFLHRDRLVALILTGVVGLLAFAMMMREAAFDPISAFHRAQSKPGAGGTNAVNTSIVDFCGYDTFGEIVGPASRPW